VTGVQTCALPISNNDIITEAGNNSNTQSVASKNAIITGSKINSFNTIKDVVSNPVLITHSYDVPKTFQISKDSVNQSIINTTNKNYQSNLKNLIDEVNTYFVNYVENKSEPMTVDAKIFENVMDFSNKVKDNMIIKQIVNNVTDAIKYTTSEKIEVKMMLKLENLGPVIIKFETKDNVINGRIDVASTATRDIIKANIVELRNSLNNLGYNVENFEVSMLNTYTSGNSHGNINYYNGQETQLPIHINNETIEDIGIIADSHSYLNYLA
jgi:flagellar hook-length control protein FliK